MNRQKPCAIQVTVSGRNEAEDELRTPMHGYTHLISIFSESGPCRGFSSFPTSRALSLRMRDIEFGLLPLRPQKEHVQQALDFTYVWTHSDRLLVHCRAGVSRSSAIAWAVMCGKGEDPKKAIARLRRTSSIIHPNRLIVQHADELLGMKGRMLSVHNELFG